MIDIPIEGTVLKGIDERSGGIIESQVADTYKICSDQPYVIHCEHCLLPDTRFKLSLNKEGNVIGIEPKDAAENLL